MSKNKKQQISVINPSEFNPQAKFLELQNNNSLSQAIKETKKYIDNYLSQDNIINDVLKNYHQIYNLNKHTRKHLKEFIIAALSFVFAQILDTLSGALEISNIDQNKWFSYITKILLIIFCVITFISLIRYSFKIFKNYTTEYELYILPYLCTKMYEYIKNNDINVSEIPFDDV